MLGNFGEDSNNLIAEHTTHQCPLLYNRSGQTVAMHLWIMSKLLSMKEPITSKRDPMTLFECLQPYVVTKVVSKGASLVETASVTTLYQVSEISNGLEV